MARNTYSKYDGLWDSLEEEYFDLWLQELINNKLIDNVIYQPERFILHEGVDYDITINLKTKLKIEHKSLLQPHSYQADFKITWNESSKNILYQNLGEIKNSTPIFFAKDNISYIDIKGSHNQHNTWQSFEINRKCVWKKYNIYINKIQPIGKKSCLFGQTFTPKKLPIWQKKDNTKLYAWVKWKVKYFEDFY